MALVTKLIVCVVLLLAYQAVMGAALVYLLRCYRRHEAKGGNR